MTRQEFIRFVYTRSLPLSIRQRIESALTSPLPSAFNSQKILFIHIPKTGGKSIRKAIGITRANHATYMDYKRLIGEDQLKDYFIFSLVRNPEERLISTWKYLLSGGNKSKEDGDLQKALTGSHKDINDFVINSLGTPLFKNNVFFKPQSSFLEDETGRIPNKITKIHLENINEEQKLLFDKAGIKEIPHLNKSPQAYISLTERSKEIIHQVYLKDFLNFGYNDNYN
ncbi:MAG: sulfotransferase family protein [Alcanivorax sp.]|nr:sulfotransferase family protein [Alcanivorax sp.]